jgi:hypothetical protein
MLEAEQPVWPPRSSLSDLDDRKPCQNGFPWTSKTNALARRKTAKWTRKTLPALDKGQKEGKWTPSDRIESCLISYPVQPASWHHPRRARSNDSILYTTTRLLNDPLGFHQALAAPACLVSISPFLSVSWKS